jgi:DNA polymerase-4
MNLLEAEKSERWRKALSAADRLRDRFGESAVSLATGLKGGFRERVHENPAGLPGKQPKDRRKPT